MSQRNGKVKIAFEKEGIVLPLQRIIPRKQLPTSVKATTRYQRIVASMKAIGLVEPLFVYPENGRDGNYLLLDGHLRWKELEDVKAESAFCLVATDDEAFTYNVRVCQMTPLEEHLMIKGALEKGLTEQEIATVLNFDVKKIQAKRDLTKGVCPEAVDMLKERNAPVAVFKELRRVRPLRQIEIAELMIAANNFSGKYVKCMVAGTPPDQRFDPPDGKAEAAPRAEDLARIRREMDAISSGMRRLEESHGRNVLDLVIAGAFLKRLLANVQIVKFLSRNYNDLMGQLQEIADLASLDGGANGREASGS